jgi:hypothetical protein
MEIESGFDIDIDADKIGELTSYRRIAAFLTGVEAKT